MTVLKKGQSSIDVVFEGKEQYTNKLHSKGTMIYTDDDGLKILLIDYSHYSNWNATKQRETEYSDYRRATNGVIRKIAILDGTIIKKLNKLDVEIIDKVDIKLTDKLTKSFIVKTIKNQCPYYLSYAI